jgi:hypothetical protein
MPRLYRNVQSIFVVFKTNLCLYFNPKEYAELNTIDPLYCVLFCIFLLFSAPARVLWT